MKRFMVIMVAMLLIGGVWGNAAAQTEDELRAAHGRLMEAMNAHNIDLWLSYCTDDFVFDYVAAASTWNKEETKPQFEHGLFQGFPDFHATPTRVLVSGNILVDEKTFTGTHQGEWEGIPATGKSVQMPCLDIFEFEGDKLKKVTVYLDVVSWLVQLGVMPAGELPPLVPSFTLPDPEPTGLAPLEASVEFASRFNSHDLVAYAKMLATDGEFRFNTLGMIPMTRDELVAAVELYLLSNSTLQAEMVRQVDLGDGWVLLEEVYEGVQDGPYFGIPASGNPVATRTGAVVHYDADGLVTHINFYFDNLGVLMKIGAVPAPGPTTVLPTTWGQVKSLFQE